MISPGSISLKRRRQAIIAWEHFMLPLRHWATIEWETSMFPRTIGYVLLSVLFMTGCMGFGSVDPDETQTITYEEHVRPLLESKCLDCHGDPPIGGSITISDEAAAITHAPRIHARAVIMGDMPPGSPLSYGEKLILDTWIRDVVLLDSGEADAGAGGGAAAGGSAGMGGMGGAAGIEGGTAGAVDPSDVDWVNYIGPLFAENCVACHSESAPQSGLDLTTFEALEAGGNQGTLLDTVNVENALLIDYIRGRNGRLVMPPSGAMPTSDIELVETWLMNGAPKGGE